MKPTVAILLLCILLAVLFHAAGGTSFAGSRVQPVWQSVPQQSLPIEVVVTATPEPTPILTEVTTATPEPEQDKGFVNPIPQSTQQAFEQFGGAGYRSWAQIEVNGWLYGSPDPAPISVPEGWRVDYIGVDGRVYSCGDTDRPGVYGPTNVVTSAATLWYVPGETECPAWTLWSRSH